MSRNNRLLWQLAERIVAFLLRQGGAEVRLTPGSGSGRRRLDLEVVRRGRVVRRVEVKFTSAASPSSAAGRARRAMKRYNPVDAPLSAVWVGPAENGAGWRVHVASCLGCDEREHVLLVDGVGEILVLEGRCIGKLRKGG